MPRRSIQTTRVRLGYPGASGLPLPKQLLALTLDERCVLFCGGVGSGKTRTGVRWALRHVARSPGSQGLILAPTVKMLRLGPLAALREAIAHIQSQTGEVIAVIKEDKGEVLFQGGSSALLRSADTPEYLSGAEVAWAWFDESEAHRNPMEAFDFLRERGRQVSYPPLRHVVRNQILVTTTPSDNPAGVVQHVVTRIQEHDPAYASVTMSSSENPYLPDWYVPDLRAQMSERNFAIRVDAKVFAESGAIFADYLKFEDWDPAHKTTCGNLLRWRPSNDLPIWIAIDWGYNHPHLLWIQGPGIIGGQPETSVVFHEHAPDQASLEDLVRYVRDYHRKTGLGLAGFVVDPGGETSAKGRRMFTEAFGCNRPGGPKMTAPWGHEGDRNINVGLEVLRVLLRRGDQTRRLLFAKNSLDLRIQTDRHGSRRNLLMCLARGYRWREVHGITGSVPNKDGVHDHAVDALRYWAVKMHGRELERVGRLYRGDLPWLDRLARAT